MNHISARRVGEFRAEARPPLPLDLDAISEREFAKLKQKVERLDKFFRVRILRGSPEEEVGVGSYHCFHHEESFTDKRHNTIIVVPGHRDFIKNKITDPLQMGTAFVIVPAKGSFATALAKDNHKEGEIQGQIRQFLSSINTVREGQTRIGVKRIEQVGRKKGIQARHKPHCGAEMPKITGMRQDPAANHRASCGQVRLERR